MVLGGLGRIGVKSPNGVPVILASWEDHMDTNVYLENEIETTGILTEGNV